MKFKFVCLLIPALAVFSCKDQPEQIPAYLKLEPFIVQEQGGAGWHKITEGWLYVNGEFLGAYTLPATVPVLAEGEADIWLYPGVKEDNNLETPNIYDFFERFEQKKVVVPAQTTVIQPETQYKSEALFAWAPERTTFDGPSNLVLDNRDTDTSNTFELVTDGAFAGRSVKMVVNSDHPTLEIITEEADLPNSGNEQVWLELHCKNDVPFAIYLIGTTGSSPETVIPAFQINTGDNWNKLYLNLTAFLILSGEEKHRLLFQVLLPRDGNGNYTQDTGAVYLDNIKLVHF